MVDYRLYLLREDGHISGAIELACDDDTTALRCATEQPRSWGAELWQGARRVGVLPASQPRDERS
jgi:hypothetical protein